MKSFHIVFFALFASSAGHLDSFGQEPIRNFGLGPNPPAGQYSEAHRFVFFAVLEGCYTDGLIDEDIDLIFSKKEKGHRDEFANFILGCPLCGPASDAFKRYADGIRLVQINSDKRYYTTFGQGLDPQVKAELAKPGQPCRDAIQGLIKKWVDARIVQMRLTEEETKTLREKLAKMRKAGENYLKTWQNEKDGNDLKKRYEDWKACPTCSGASPMGGVSE